MAFQALLDPQELAREKDVVLAEIDRSQDSPNSRIFHDLQSRVWAGTGYAWPILGFRESVANLSDQALKEYVRRQYQPQSMLLLVCGKVKAREVLDAAQRLFGSLQNTRELRTPEVIDPALLRELSVGVPRIEVQRGAWNKVYIGLAFPTPGFTAAEEPGLEILAHILGGDRASRWYRKFKYELQLVDDISVYSMTPQRTGMFYVSATLDAGKLDAFWTACLEELASLKDADFSDEELLRARLNIEDSLFQAKETLAGLASKLGYFQLFKHSVLAEDNYLYAVNSVDNAQLKQLVATWIQPERFFASLLLPHEKENGSAKDQAAGVIGDPATATLLTAKKDAVWPDAAARARALSQRAEGKTESVDLGDGARLVLLPDPTLPYTSIDLSLRGGDALLLPDEQGLAELAAKVLTKGTASRSATQIQEFLSDRAATLGAGTTRDVFSLTAKFPTRFTADMLDLFLEVLTRPAFAPEEAAREKQNLVATIKSREDQPVGLAFRYIFPFLYANTYYSYFHLGEPSRIEAFSPQSILSFWEKQRSRPWVMAVCGDFDRAAILDAAKSLAGRLRGGGEALPAPAFAKPEWRTVREKTLTLEQRNQTHLLLVFEAPGLLDADTPGLALLRAILTGQSGLLFTELREDKALGYAVSAMVWQSPSTGFVAFYIGTQPEKREQAIEGFRVVLDRLRSAPLPEEAVQRGKNVLVGEYYRDHQSLSSRSSEAATLLSQGQDLDANRRMLDQVASLTPADLQALARKYLKWNDRYLLQVQP